MKLFCFYSFYSSPATEDAPEQALTQPLLRRAALIQQTYRGGFRSFTGLQGDVLPLPHGRASTNPRVGDCDTPESSTCLIARLNNSHCWPNFFEESISSSRITPQKEKQRRAEGMELKELALLIQRKKIQGEKFQLTPVFPFE